MIEEVKTGRSVPVRVTPVGSDDLRELRGRWRFKWLEEAEISEVFKLEAIESPGHILGLMSIGRNPGYVEVKWLDSSPPNVGRKKKFRRIAGTLLAAAARLSFRLGNDGVLMMISKSKLVEHCSKTYGFQVYQKDRKMILDTPAAFQLIVDYGTER